MFFVFAFFCNFFWGLSFLASRVALDSAPVTVLLSHRFLLAFLLMSVLFLSGHADCHLRGKSILPLLLLGLMQPVIYFIGEQYGILHSTTIFSGVMISIIPIAGILAAILIKKLFNIDIEHYLCIGISFLIIYTGIQMLRECVTKILGTTVDPEFRKKIKSMIIMEDSVYNVSNLVLHNYGEGVYVGSVDIEVDKNMRAEEIGKLSRRLIQKADDLGLTLTAVGISGIDTDSPEANKIWDEILDIVRQHERIIRANSFTVDPEEKQISFCIVQDPNDPDKKTSLQDLQNELCRHFPDMTISIQIQSGI